MCRPAHTPGKQGQPDNQGMQFCFHGFIEGFWHLSDHVSLQLLDALPRAF
jgi:hypothetical protein